jgi:bromodomain-containing factor 1
MEIANQPRLATASNTALPPSAARKPAFLFHGPMAVMTSPTVDKNPLDLKASAFAPADTMAVDAEANG